MAPLVSKIKALLPRSEFLRSVVVLAGGTAAGQVLLVLVSPVLTRMYTPEAFGVLAVYTSILSVLLVIVSGRYDVAIPVPNDDDSALHLLMLALVLNVSASVLLAAVLLVYYGSISFPAYLAAMRPYLWFMPISLFGAGTYQALNYWGVRKKAYTLVARTKLSQSVGQTLTQLSLGYLAMGPMGLILGDVVGRIAGSSTLAAFAWKGDATCSKVATRKVIEVGKRFKRFPLYSIWSSLLNSISAQIPTVLFSTLYGQGVAGLYALCIRVLQAPMSLVGNAIAQVFFTNARDAYQEHRLPTETVLVFTRLVQIGVPILTLVSIGAAPVFALVFGPQWREAGVYAQWLSPWLFLVFVTSPLSTLVYVLEHQRGELIFQGVLMIARVSVLSAGGRLGGALTAIALYSAASTLLWFIYLGWIMEISGNSLRAAIGILSSELVHTLLLSAPAAVARLLSENEFCTLGGVAVSACLITWRLVSIWRKEEVK